MAAVQSAAEFVRAVSRGSVSVEEHTAKVLEKIKKQNKTYSHFSLISESEALAQARDLDRQIKTKKHNRGTKLLGLPVSVKDCICVRGIESRAGSKILSGYNPTFDAAVVERVRKEGAVMIGKTSQDEFGFGSFSVNVGIGFEVPKNPHDMQRACGGSSGGAAGIAALADFPHVALAESTGGSIAAPAAFCGVVGLCPTYGRVSRYGLIDYANSLDKIGPIAKTVEDAALMLSAIAGNDPKDSTSLPNEVPDYSKSVGAPVKGLKIGVVKEAFGKGCDSAVAEAVWKKIKALEVVGVAYEEVSLPLNFRYAIAAYYLIATSEASTNLARYCGMRYGLHEKLEGNFNDYFSSVRTSGFGKEAKRRIVLGTFARMSGFRDAYYLRAMRVRAKLMDEYKRTFKRFSALASPAMPVVAPRFDEIKKLTPMQNYMMDVMTCPANLAGLPHLSLNAGSANGMPAGIMLTADHLCEEKLIALGSAIEGAK